ncbi:MAG: STAS domain-containing protein [Brevinematia bacterium]
MKLDTIGDIDIVRLEGTINVQTSIELESWLNSLIPRKQLKKVIIDLSKVQHISSSGLRVLVSFYKRIVSNSGKLIMAGLNQNLKKIFKIVELDTVFETYNSVEEAINKLGET